MAATFRYLNFEYEVIDSQKNEVALIDASHATGTITIPSEVECNGRKFKVTKISGKRVEYWYQPDDRRRKKECRNEFRGAFQGKYYFSYDGSWTDSSSIIEVVIPNSVTSIGNNAFEDCRKLTSITIPNSVTKIGDAAFKNCVSLTSIVIPDGVTSIGEWAFWYCSSLTSVIIGDGITSIKYVTFAYCSSLTSIIIPNSVTIIEACAFVECKSLTSITIPNSVTRIEKEAFKYCHRLTSITIPDSLISIGNAAFYFCEKLTSITIPSSVTSIGDDAFDCCFSLHSLTIDNEEGKVKIGKNVVWSFNKINYVGKPQEQPAKPIENPYHQAIREAEEAAAKAAEKTTVNVETTPEPSQPVSPTTTQTRNRDKADYVFNGKVYTKKVQLVHDLVLHHLSLHPDLTYEQLKKDFQVQKNMDVMFMSYEMYLSTLAEKGIVYFFESKTEEDTIALQDAKILISSNWPTMVGGKPSVFAKFLDKAKELGYEITVQD